MTARGPREHTRQRPTAARDEQDDFGTGTMAAMASERIIRAAGGIVWRKRRGGSNLTPVLEVLVIHRPSYDDWTFPKGKVEPDEMLPVTAAREIAEETGLRVRLGVPLPTVDYQVARGRKVVSYWCARVVTSTEVPFTSNQEVDELRWLPVHDALRLLTYEHDVELLEQFHELRAARALNTRTLVVLRHGKALARTDFAGDDLERPLSDLGRDQAAALVPVLGSFGVRRVVSSPAARCATTVEPYAHSIGTFLEIDDRLAEDARPGQVERSIDTMLDRKDPVVLCTHRPTLPRMFEALGVPPRELAVAEAVVLHHRRGEIVAVEAIGPP